MDQKKLAELEVAKIEAEQAVTAYRRETDRLASEARFKVIGEREAGMESLNEKRVKAANAYRDYVDACADHPWDGKFVVAKTNRFRDGYSVVPVGARCLVEVWRSGAKFPANQIWGEPALGDIAVRPLKKDGKPAIRVLTSYRPDEIGRMESDWSLETAGD